jgi:hypothetical protein
VTVTNPSGSFGPDGGSGSVAVSTTRECAWSASASGAWIHLTSGQSGQGEGTVGYRVDANADPVARHAAVSVNGQQAPVAQDAAPCRYDVALSTDSVAASGGRTTADVRTHAACRWTAAANASWMTISPQSGQGPGTIGLTAAPNIGPERTVTLTIGPDSVVLRQLSPPLQPAAPAPAPAPNPPPGPAPTPAPQPPAPAPQPPPAPAPTPAPIDITGKIGQLKGSCPVISFAIDHTQVETTAATDFSPGSCKDIKNKDTVTVRGLQQPDGTVIADSVVEQKR